ncbi:MAG: ribonuclease HII [Deltaproteobacteria bacterium]|nr:ribonuclease HII [Deltaproteobacteria bacterium]
MIVSAHETLPLFPEQAGGLAVDPLFYEKWARKAGYGLVAGVDEAGRGPLAGPVVAGAVIFGGDQDLSGIRDSKQMTPKMREKAFGFIQRAALTTGIAVVSHQYIDEFNILKASLEAMSRAVAYLDPRPEILLIDGIHPIPVAIPQKCLTKGDRICRSISAASILAKVYRDRIMRAWHQMYPVYDFDKNKGYGTAQHLAALKAHGPCPIHRVSFRRVVQE